ncbi:hypothetical protein N431DRAFT_470566 [Stipitochalara longipes BDJ]|nr:hypothetical protein N431DRAFT_470566 [Stipitochalara longipes BDJ]
MSSTTTTSSLFPTYNSTPYNMTNPSYPHPQNTPQQPTYLNQNPHSSLPWPSELLPPSLPPSLNPAYHASYLYLQMQMQMQMMHSMTTSTPVSTKTKPLPPQTPQQQPSLPKPQQYRPLAPRTRAEHLQHSTKNPKTVHFVALAA